jgi:hypothetical protein
LILFAWMMLGLRGFAMMLGIANYMDPMMARQALPGAEQVNWT